MYGSIQTATLPLLPMLCICKNLDSMNVDGVVVLIEGGGDTSTLHAVIKLFTQMR